ncbi:MAG: hypothetical protein MPF33_08660 [Candidatus Aramenus sp.]|nr:hypothetical protein [Candidatus Aramenus sp.]
MSEKEEKEKVNIKALVNVVPPASALKGEKKAPLKEKRVKIRKKGEVEEGTLIISVKLAKDIGVKGKVEISVKGKRLELSTITQEGLPEIEVWANPNDMVKLGLEDNSTVTLRVIQ